MASKHIFVYFRAMMPDGAQFENNCVLSDVPLIRSLADVVALQRVLADINHAVDTKIISWQRLEGSIIH